MNRDYITLVQASKPINKRVTLDDNGRLTKTPAGQITRAKAKTVHVPDMASFADVYRELGRHSNMVLILGFIPGTEAGSPFFILSTEAIAMRIGCDEAEAQAGPHEIDGTTCYTRTKSNFSFSSWCMFDYDRVAGMPHELETDDRQTWLTWLGQMIPGFADAGVLLASSTSSRVLRDGKPAFKAKGWHGFVQLGDGGDAERFGRELLIHAMGSKFGFMRPLYSQAGKTVGHRPWAIFDPTTFSPERVVYDGAPVVSGEGLTLVDVMVEIREGGRLDTSLLKLDPVHAAQLEHRTGLTVKHLSSDGNYSYSLINSRDLKMSTELDTKKGKMTLSEYWLSDHGKLRCQSPFRPDSRSFAAFVSRHEDGTPFLYDVGTQTKYILGTDEVDRYMFGTDEIALGEDEDELTAATGVQAVLEWIDDGTEAEVRAGWTARVLGLDVIDQEEARQAVHKKTGIGLRVLAKALSEANKKESARLSQERRRTEAAALAEAGRVTIEWREDDLPAVVRQVKARLVEHVEPGLMLDYGGVLTEVRKTHPRSVRQIQRRAELGEEAYPPTFVAFSYTSATLACRVLESAAFYQPEARAYGPCPSKVAQILLDDPAFAPPLAGLLEVPSITPAGRVLDRPGYDRASGFFCTFSDDLCRAIPARATRDDAVRALNYLTTVVFEGFPFASEIDRAGAVAMLLTAFVRRFLPAAPGFMVSATTQASGKSTLVEIIFQAAFGRPAAASSWSDDQAEMQKHILGILVEGHSGVCFDNLPFGCRVDGDELAKLITQQVYSARLLGTNTTAAMPTNVLVAITGNQLAAVNDMPSRLLPITLTPDTDNPGRTRHRRRDIGSWLEQHRPEIVRAVLTICVAWHSEGKAVFDEVEPPEPSRFPVWDEAVRHPLIWLGLADCGDAFDANQAEDPIRAERERLLAAWHDRYGDDWIDLKEIAEQWRDYGFDHDYTVSRDIAAKNEELREALVDLFPDKRPTAKHIGLNFRYFKDAVIGGYRLIQRPASNGSRKPRPWRVVTVA